MEIEYGVGINVAFTSAKFVQRVCGSFWWLISVRSIKKFLGHLSVFFLTSVLTHHPIFVLYLCLKFVLEVATSTIVLNDKMFICLGLFYMY